MNLKLGVGIGYWGLGLEMADQVRLVREAEALGFDSAWTGEAYGSDALTILGWLAAQTSTIRLGTGIAQIPARPPAAMAMAAATLDRLSDGRFMCGLGPTGPQISEGWYGVPFARQIERTRDYVAVMRAAFSHELVRYKGQTLELPLPDGEGKALRLTIRPVQDRIPIYLAALGPNAVALAGEIADGWMPAFFSPQHTDALYPHLREGAARAGRAIEDIEIMVGLGVIVTDDLDAARDSLRPLIGLYLGGMGSRKTNFYQRLAAAYGFEDAARRVQDLFLDGHQREAMAAIPAELIDTVSVIGPPDVVRDRLLDFEAAGVNTVMVAAIGADSIEEKIANLRALAEARG